MTMMYICDDCKEVFPEEELSMTWDGAYPEDERYIASCPYCGSEWVEETWEDEEEWEQ